MSIRFSEKFNDKSQYSVAPYKETDHGSRLEVTVLEYPQDNKEKQTFQQNFIELGRMPGHGPASGENHGPRHGTGPTV